jgi:signal peptidase II
MTARIYQQLCLLIGLLLLDQWTKHWIEQQLPFFHMVVLDGYFDLVKAHNFGVAFSMFADWNHAWRTNLLLMMTGAIATAVAIWWWKERNKAGLETWLFVLILAGAFGNIWDRVSLGYVVDFIDWYVIWQGTEYHWPAFNIADSCISMAVVGLLFSSLKQEKA